MATAEFPLDVGVQAVQFLDWLQHYAFLFHLFYALLNYLEEFIFIIHTFYKFYNPIANF